MIPTAASNLDDHPYASRGGLKLEAALLGFQIDVQGLVCADLGCSTGGFVSCLLHHGAQRVYAVDTAYGELAWPLRQDPRVVVMERTNALHAEVPADDSGRKGVDLVTMDLGWTRQDKALPVAKSWLAQGQKPGLILSLVKPHYERPRETARRKPGAPKHPPLTDDQARAIAAQTLEQVQDDLELGLELVGCVESPIHGGKGGNLEMLALLRPRT